LAVQMFLAPVIEGLQPPSEPRLPRRVARRRFSDTFSHTRDLRQPLEIRPRPEEPCQPRAAEQRRDRRLSQADPRSTPRTGTADRGQVAQVGEGEAWSEGRDAAAYCDRNRKSVLQRTSSWYSRYEPRVSVHSLSPGSTEEFAFYSLVRRDGYAQKRGRNRRHILIGALVLAFKKRLQVFLQIAGSAILFRGFEGIHRRAVVFSEGIDKS